MKEETLKGVEEADEELDELVLIEEYQLDFHGNSVAAPERLKERAAKLRMYQPILEAVAVKLEVSPYPLGGSIGCLTELDRLMVAIKKLLG